MPRSTSLPANMSSLDVLEGTTEDAKSEKAHSEQHHDSDLATDAGVDDVIASDSSHCPESEADNCNSSSASAAGIAGKTRTPLNSKAREWQPDNGMSNAPQYIPAQQVGQLPVFDSLPFEFVQDATQLIASISKMCENRRAVLKVETFPAADGGWNMFLHIDDLRAAKKLLDNTMDALLEEAEASMCTYVLGCEEKPFYISAGGLCFTAYLAAMRDEDFACRSMYDRGFCHGPCKREHPCCVLRLTVTALDSNNPFGMQ